MSLIYFHPFVFDLKFLVALSIKMLNNKGDKEKQPCLTSFLIRARFLTSLISICILCWLFSWKIIRLFFQSTPMSLIILKMCFQSTLTPFCCPQTPHRCFYLDLIFFLAIFSLQKALFLFLFLVQIELVVFKIIFSFTFFSILYYVQ